MCFGSIAWISSQALHLHTQSRLDLDWVPERPEMDEGSIHIPSKSGNENGLRLWNEILLFLHFTVPPVSLQLCGTNPPKCSMNFHSLIYFGRFQQLVKPPKFTQHPPSSTLSIPGLARKELHGEAHGSHLPSCVVSMISNLRCPREFGDSTGIFPFGFVQVEIYWRTTKEQNHIFCWAH